MEDWQQEIITRNNRKLISYVKGNVGILSGLFSKGLLDEMEKEDLITIGDNRGSFRQADALLGIIITKTQTDDKDPNKRVPAFDAFIQVLDDQKQSGAVDMLRREQDEYWRNKMHQDKMET